MTEEKDLKKGLISVVMSNYNTPINYLKESIDSVLNQTYSNFEFIIIDDGSTNDSLEFIKSYNDPRIKLITNEENIGLTKSLNKGLDVAQGEFIARMDTDDICYPERFEKQFEYMNNHPDTFVCGTWPNILRENGNIATEKWACSEINDMDVYRIYLLFGCLPPFFHSSSFINHQLLLDNHIRYNNKYRYSQDYELWTRTTRIANTYIIPEPLLIYRMHKESIGHAKRNLQKECDYGIIQDQLNYLHLKLKDNVKVLHIIFLKDDIHYSNEVLYDLNFKKWLKELIRANKKYKRYNHKKFKKTLWYNWSRMCYVDLSRSKLTKRIKILLSLSIRCKINLIIIKRNYLEKNKNDK